MDIPAIVLALAAAVAEIDELNVYDYAAGSVAVPAAIIPLPIEVTYDRAKAGGFHYADARVHVLVGNVSDRDARDRLGAYLSTEGDSSIKAAIELEPTLDGTVDDVQVTGVEVAVITVGAVDYLAGSFAVHLIAT